MRRLRPAVVRFYADADILGTAKVLGALRNDLTFPGDPGADIHGRRRPPCPVAAPGTLDVDWIPRIAAEGWVVVTRDANIHGNYAELEAVRTNGAKMVALTGPAAGSKWGQLSIIFRSWPRIEAAHTEPGPFVYRASAAGVARLNLDATLAKLRGR